MNCGSRFMATVEMLAAAAIEQNALAVRAIAQELLRLDRPLADLPAPSQCDERGQIVAAALIELLAERSHQTPPDWTATMGSLAEPFHLLASSTRMPGLRAMCERESPEPLRRRKLYAPADYLTFA